MLGPPELGRVAQPKLPIPPEPPECRQALRSPAARPSSAPTPQRRSSSRRGCAGRQAGWPGASASPHPAPPPDRLGPPEPPGPRQPSVGDGCVAHGGPEASRPGSSQGSGPVASGLHARQPGLSGPSGTRWPCEAQAGCAASRPPTTASPRRRCSCCLRGCAPVAGGWCWSVEPRQRSSHGQPEAPWSSHGSGCRSHGPVCPAPRC